MKHLTFLKTILIPGLCLAFCIPAITQIAVNPTGAPPHPAAGLDVDFTNKGFLPPRLSATQVMAIPSPAPGLILFNTSQNAPAYYDGIAWRTFDGTKAWLTCGDPIRKVHSVGAVAPVNKTVNYGTVTGIPGETTKCWITSNLGADHPADSVNDPTEASAGWYWKFNRPRGYKHNGTFSTPAWSTAAISESFDWLQAYDPCAIELGPAWRVPTKTEWTNVDAAGSWTTWNGPWNSALHVHAAGRISPTTGALTGKGTYGRYWSGTQDANSTAWALLFSTNCYLNNDSKYQGYNLRCIR